MNKIKPIQGFLLLIMRVTLTQVLILVMFTSLVSAAPLNGQGIMDRAVSLNISNKEIKAVLSEIEKQAAVSFTYSAKLVQLSSKVSINVVNVSLKDVLNDIFNSTIDFVVIDDEIVLKPKSSTAITAEDEANTVNEIAVSGTVLDETGQPLPGVSILEKGSLNGTNSDADGQYKLNVENAEAVLVFSFMGYRSQEIPVNGNSVINVNMQADLQMLSEIVVVGYGERKKENYTGSISSVSSKDLVRAPVANLSNALTGRAPGVIAVQRTGEPGRDQSDIFIRGISTFGNNQPLIVVDGIMRDNFSQLDPNEIETINILKDPASAGAFGMRGANGVILVTTKRGKEGKTELSFSARSDWQRPTRLPQYVNSDQYAQLVNEGLLADGKPARYSDTEVEAFRTGSNPDAYPNTDWVDQLVSGYAPQQQYNLTLNGGTQKVKYFLSGGHVDQKGAYANNEFQRYNLRSNIDVQATATTKVTMDVSGRNEDRRHPYQQANQLFYWAISNPPTAASYYSNGRPGAYQGRNPIEEAKNGGYDKTNRTTILTNASITQEIPFIKGLSVKGNAAYDWVLENNKTWQTPITYYNYDVNAGTTTPITNTAKASVNQTLNQTRTLTLETHINYAKTFGKHEIAALGLYTQQHINGYSITAARSNFSSTALDQIFAGDAATQTNTGSGSEAFRKSYYGRINYVFNGKYLAEVGVRRDGSYIFAPGSRWGTFPAFSVGWKISEEKFFSENISFINFLKVRASYGQLGNDRIDPYRWQSAFNVVTGYPFNGTLQQALRPTGAADPTTTWEKAKSTNVGFESSFFNNLISLEVDLFRKRTEGILTSDAGRPTPQTLGQTLPTRNIGIVDNRGIEITLKHQNEINTSGFSYFIEGNFTFAQNKMVFNGEASTTPFNTKRTGRSLYQYYGLTAIGYFQDQNDINNSPVQNWGAVKPGDIKYKDINGRDANGNLVNQPDGKVNGDDVMPIGRSAIPQVIYGINGGVKFRAFDVNFLLQGSGRVNSYVSGELVWPFYSASKPTTDVVGNTWTEQNPNAKYPRLTSNYPQNNSQASTFWLKDASYLRLKNLQIGYNFPKALLSKARITNARFFVSGQNLLTFDKLKLVDPEGVGSTTANGQVDTSITANAPRGWFYPVQKIYSMGLNLTF